MESNEILCPEVSFNHLTKNIDREIITRHHSPNGQMTLEVIQPMSVGVFVIRLEKSEHSSAISILQVPHRHAREPILLMEISTYGSDEHTTTNIPDAVLKDSFVAHVSIPFFLEEIEKAVPVSLKIRRPLYQPGYSVVR